VPEDALSTTAAEKNGADGNYSSAKSPLVFHSSLLSWEKPYQPVMTRLSHESQDSDTFLASLPTVGSGQV
jgi:hypothetical protein